VKSFPDLFFAGPLGFTEEPYYQDDDISIQTAPKVEFGRPAA
jgi:LemA protein